MKRSTTSCLILLAVLATAAQAETIIETVPVGYPENDPDTRYESPGYGAVNYSYNIGKYEVTAGQYTEFLNAVARTDTYGLYNPYMWDDPWLDYGCRIQQSGSSGSYTYSVAPDWANRPVNYVSYGDAMRFANWLHNGQPGSITPVPQDVNSTEDGAYFVNGATSNAALVAINREGDWEWAVTSEDEWYKAAYHKNDGVTGNYWDYPTGTDSPPSNDLINPDPGNNATYNDWLDGHFPNGYTIGSPYYRTEVGAHENSDSPYGTFDQAGNVWELNEAVVVDQIGRSNRGMRGGSFSTGNTDGYDYNQGASFRNGNPPAGEDTDYGFRVVQVPEPGSITLLLCGLASLALLRRRR